MVSSLLLKLVMLAATMSVVFWIGWSVPQSRYADAHRGGNAQANEHSSVPLPPSEQSTAVTETSLAGFSNTPRPMQVPSRSLLATLDLNRASEQELEALPGIGPVLAERIVEYRHARGTFHDVEQLRKVKGIGKKKFERLRTLVHVAPAKAPVREGREAT
ncbi:MAG TPA: helix-hairpin-helix domain-containing protein [Nitrospira sp.]|nr:helix-hairpin-helix domain-containing protein [Nitrospira sp.]